MGAGGDGPCLASWLLRCAETSLSKWNPHPPYLPEGPLPRRGGGPLVNMGAGGDGP